MAKRPYVREWYHGEGEATYAQKPATKALIARAVKARKKGADVVVATSGRLLKSREYTPQAFLRKYPKWKIKKPTKKERKR